MCVIRKLHRRSLIQELMLCEFKLGHNAAEAAKNICVKAEGSFDYSSVTRWFKKFRPIRKKLNDQGLFILQATEANKASSTRRVSGELGISQSCVVCHLHLDKSIWSNRIVFHVPKYCKNFSLVWFYDISSNGGYLMPNPVFTYILNIGFVNTFLIHTIKGSNSSISNNSI